MKESDASATGTLALLEKLKSQMPEIWNQAEVVGKWVWLEFNVAPAKIVREKLKELGFHWNHVRKCWQHPCGVPRGRSGGDPRGLYPVVPAPAFELKETVGSSPSPRIMPAKEYKVVALQKFEAAGYEFGDSILDVMHCPCCPKGGIPDPKKAALKAVIVEMMGDDEDGIASTMEGFGL